MIRKWVLICCLILGLGNAHAQLIKDTVRVANHARSNIDRILNSCRAKLRYRTKDIKNGSFSVGHEIGFFKQTLKSKLLYKFDAFRCCNFTIIRKNQHVGVSEFIYKNKMLANRVFKYLKSNERYSLSEVYIKFKPVQIGTSVFIVLTETPDDIAIKKLLGSL
ncbi:hypothetical protein [Mucilaginibacter ginsenosidivorax]|uniref:Uncharacterized protein n=1 Tax=Mucilaginibacter ginsenosidivorax TaxID=862126 RepID=A0A5B8W435_9SPHI|nr:hypothetical protein [Mucilaginibacter ginsenosidivorax]QEC78157.1 hypothetical protein FSB76_20270 [Mucilaginibacter ginsenosidivorax]